MTGGPQGYAAAGRSGQASSVLTAGSAAARGTPSRAQEWARLRNEWAEEARMPAKHEACLLGKGCPGGEQARGKPRTARPRGSQSRVLLKGLVSKSSLVNLSDPGSLAGVGCTSLRRDGFQREGIWEDRQLGISSLLRTFPEFLPVDGGLLVPCSLPGRPVVKLTAHARGYSRSSFSQQFPLA